MKSADQELEPLSALLSEGFRQQSDSEGED